MSKQSLLWISFVSQPLLLPGCRTDAGATDDGATTQAATTETSAFTLSTSGPGDTSLADVTSQGSESSGSGVSTSTTDSSETGIGPGTIVLDEVCPLLERVGEVTVWIVDQPFVVGVVYDRPDPWIGPAELENADCEFHRFTPDACNGCAPGEVCSFAGECVPQRQAFTAAELDVTADGTTQTITANEVTGQLFGDLGSGTADVTLTLRFGDEQIEVPALPFAAPLSGLMMELEGDSSAPMSLDVTWSPRDDGSRVRTVVPINHHAAGPTFTYCDVPASQPGFHADEGMLVPLAVITGLEFQGIDVARTAAAYTSSGCIEFRVGVEMRGDLG